MNFEKHISKSDLFHAYLIAGNTDSLSNLVNHIKDELGIRAQGNPDFFLQEYESFGIDDSRDITQFASTRPLGEYKIIIWYTPFMTVAAQDALLKLFEEPPAHTHFFIVSETASSLRPTLLSRSRLLVSQYSNKEEDFVKDFTRDTYKKRFTTIAKIVKDKNKGKALQLLDGLEDFLFVDDYSKRKDAKDVLNAIQIAREYIGDNGVSLKMLLENIALTLPISKT